MSPTSVRRALDRIRRSSLAAAAVGLVLAGVSGTGAAHAAVPAASRTDACLPGACVAPALTVDATGHLLDHGVPWHAQGVDKAGSEYACVQGWGLFEGTPTQQMVDTWRAWHVDVVRLPLNEDCWLGLNGVNPKFATVAYRTAVLAAVDLLGRNGMAAELDLHWSAPGTELATAQQPMADLDHAPAFWRGVAAAVLGRTNVLFDLYNEPYGISWSCWRAGGCTAVSTRGTTYTVAGMNRLIAAVRASGSTAPVVAGGLQWANDLSGWLANRPSDPAGQLVAGAHVYSGNECRTTSCFDSVYASILATTPVLIGESGPGPFATSPCTADFQTGTLFPWANSRPVGQVGYVAWAWNKGSCGGPSLVTDPTLGTPTVYGQGVHDYFVAH